MRDSYRPIRTKIVFYDANEQPIGHRDVGTGASTDVRDFYQQYNDMVTSIEASAHLPPIMQPGDAGWVCTVALVDPGVEVAQMLSLAVGERYRVDIGFGYETDPASWFEFSGVILRRSFSLGVEGFTFTVVVLTKAHLSCLTKDRRIPWDVPGNSKTTADIVREFLRRSALDAVPPVIQNDSRLFPRPLAYDGITSPLSFIMYQILPYAPPVQEDSGVGRPYVFYFDSNGAVHFHTDGYQNSWVSSTRTIPTYHYRDPEGDVLSVEVVTDALTASMMGYSAVLAQNTDARTAAEQIKLDVRGSTVKEGAPSTVLSGSEYVPNTGTVPRLLLRSVVDDERVGEVALAMQKLRRAFCRFTMTVLGNTDVQLMWPLRFIYSLPNGDEHFLTGYYTVYAVRHRVDETGWVTTVEAWREGTSKTDPTVAKPAELRGLAESNTGTDRPSEDEKATPPPVIITPPTIESLVAEIRANNAAVGKKADVTVRKGPTK